MVFGISARRGHLPRNTETQQSLVKATAFEDSYYTSDGESDNDGYSRYSVSLARSANDVSSTVAQHAAHSRGEHIPHDQNLLTHFLNLQDMEANKDCRNFRDDVKELPCLRALGFPHVLDLRRYQILDHVDGLHEIPLLVDVITTLLYLHGGYKDVKNLNLTRGPEFVYTLLTENELFEVVREEGSDQVKVGLGPRGQNTWTSVVKYAITLQGEWVPKIAECQKLGRHHERKYIEAVGIGIGRAVLKLVINLGDEEIRHNVRFGESEESSFSGYSQDSERE